MAKKSIETNKPTVQNQTQNTKPSKDPAATWEPGSVDMSHLLNRSNVPLVQRQNMVSQLGNVLGNQKLISTITSASTIQRRGELANTSPINAVEQDTVNEILNPNQTETGETESFIEEDFEEHMREKLDEYVTPEAERARERLDPSSPKLDLSHIQDNIATEAQSVVREKFGSYAQAASMSASDRRHQNRYQLGRNIRAYSSQPINTAVLRDLTEYLMTVGYVGGPTMVDHNCDRTRREDTLAFRQVRDRYLSEHRDELTLIQKAWPGETDPNTLRVTIQTNLSPDPDQDATAVERRGNWRTFQTLIHEYVHVLEHPQFYEMARQQSSTGYQILIEGFCDHFAEQVWQDIEPTLASDSARRERIEGEVLAFDGDAIPEWDSYPEIEQAHEIAQEVGEENACAAYFMGHTELLGSGDYSSDDAVREGFYIIPERGQSVAAVAAMTNVPVDELARLNSVTGDDHFPAGELISCPGIHYHVVIRFDIGLRIAEQYGISFPQLNRANPGVDWRAIRPGQRLLIPRP